MDFIKLAGLEFEEEQMQINLFGMLQRYSKWKFPLMIIGKSRKPRVFGRKSRKEFDLGYWFNELS